MKDIIKRKNITQKLLAIPFKNRLI